MIAPKAPSASPTAFTWGFAPNPTARPSTTTRTSRHRILGLGVAVVLASAEARAESTPELAELKAAIDEEKRARAALEARFAKDEAEARRALPPTESFGPIVVSGFVHMDWVVFRQSSQDEVTQDGQPLNEDRFVLRRARIRAEGDHGAFHGVLEIDANTTAGFQLRPIDAEATVKWPPSRPYARTPWAYDPIGDTAGAALPRPTQRAPLSPSPDAAWFMVTAGLFRTPFGFEVPEAERERPLLERTTVSNALFPQSFDLGLRVVGGFRFVRYALAIMNGEPIGERSFPGRDPNESKDLVFRVGGASAIADKVRIEGGVSGLTGRGFHRGVAASKDVLQWLDANADGVVDPGELSAIPGAPATPSSSFKRFAVGADLRATFALPILGDLALRAEIVRAQNLDRGLYVSDPVASTRDLRQLGWYVGASQEVTRWALVAVRYDRYDPDADAREQEPFAVVPRDLAQSTWSFSLTARTTLARLVAQYDHRQNALGRDVSGRPTTLKDDAFTLRGEVRF